MVDFKVHVYRKQDTPVFTPTAKDTCVRLGDNRYLFKVENGLVTELVTCRRKLGIVDNRAVEQYRVIRKVVIHD